MELKYQGVREMNFVVLVLALVVQGQADVDLGDSGFVRWEGAGFGAMEPGTVRFNENLPRENNVQTDEPYPIPVSQLTDGRGLVIRCKPGQGVVLHGRPIRSFWPVLPTPRPTPTVTPTPAVVGVEK